MSTVSKYQLYIGDSFNNIYKNRIVLSINDGYRLCGLKIHFSYAYSLDLKRVIVVLAEGAYLIQTEFSADIQMKKVKLSEDHQ